LKRKWIAYLSVILVILYTFNSGCTVRHSDQTTQTNKTSLTDPCDNIYFTKWLGYIGYALYEERGQLQLSYVNYNKSSAFEDSILSVELLPGNQIITVDNFSFLDGPSSKILDIRTIDIDFNIINTGSTDINKLLFHMKNGKDYIWDIGSIQMEVVDLPQYKHLTLGVRSFVASDFDNYFFILNNGTSDKIRLISLEYSMPKGTLAYNLKDSRSQTEESAAGQNTDLDLLMANESRMFKYSLEYTQYGECDYFIFKPLLKYELDASLYSMPLDFCIYSSNFTEEVMVQIKKNHYLQN
jgi:hypothetical protein